MKTAVHGLRTGGVMKKIKLSDDTVIILATVGLLVFILALGVITHWR